MKPLTIAGNQNSGVIRITANVDDEADPDETFLLDVSISKGTATFAIGGTSVTGITGTIIEGLTEAQKTAINEAIGPQAASAMAVASGQILQGRINNALSGESPNAATAFAELIQQSADGGRPSSFVMPLQAQADAAGPANGKNNFTLWGQIYQSQLDGESDMTKFDGNVSGGLLGIDFQSNEWLVGLAFHQGEAELDYELTANITHSGTHTTELAGIHPYLARESGSQRLWGSIGIESGTIDITETGAIPATSYDVQHRSLRFGGQDELCGPEWEGDGRLNIIGDIAHSSLSADADSGTADSMDTTSGRLRLGLQYRQDRPGGQGQYAELALRYDYGDGLTGAGLELGGGADWHYPNSGLSLDLNARALLTHTETLSEWGIAGALAWRAKDNGHGLSFAFQPRWGDMQSKQQHLWEQGAADYSASATPQAHYAMELKYGIGGLSEDALLTLFARDEGTVTKLGADYQFGDGLTAGFESLRQPDTTPPTTQRAWLKLHYDF